MTDGLDEPDASFHHDSSSDIEILTTGVERSTAELLALVAHPSTNRAQVDPANTPVEGDQPRV